MARTTSGADLGAMWRAEVIDDFRLRGAERCAAAASLHGFPQILDSILEHLVDVPAGPWIDVSAGLGGTSSWIERTTHRRVALFDDSPERLRAARRLFPDLSTTCADGDRLPLRTREVSVAIFSSHVSQRSDFDPVIGEASRALAEGGRVVLMDLWAVGSTARPVGRRTFHSLDVLRERAARHGLEPIHVAVADLTTGWWSAAAEQVDEEIRDRFRDRPGFVEWEKDRARLEESLDDGLIAAGVILACSAGTVSSD